MKEFHELDPAEQPEGEVIQHEPPANERSLARRISLQILYEVDSAGHSAGSVMAIHLQARQVPRKASRYVHLLVDGVTEHRVALDQVIQRYAPEWPVEQMAIVDRNVLRLAILEFAVYATTPVGVAIDEAVQLAKLFGAENSPGFVNGVLGALADDEVLISSLRVPGLAESEETGE